MIFSLILHLGISVLFYLFPNFDSDHAKKIKEKKTSVTFVKPENFLPPPNAKNVPLVDIAKPKVQKRPKKARAVSVYDSTVKKETVAKKIPKKANPKIEVSEKNKTSKQKTKLTKKSKTKKETSPLDLNPKIYDLEKFKLGDFEDKRKSKKKENAKQNKSFDPAPRGFEKSGPGDKFVHDFLPSVQIGDKTYLNTQSMPNVQYFTRLKRIFRMRFNPGPPLIAHFRQNRVVVGKVNVTMAMEVDSTGKLTKIFVVRSSGIPAYDRESMNTARASSPFSAPPKAIRSKDGVLRMTWDFTTYL